MRVAVVCKSDSTGGAAIVSRRLTEALREAGADAEMLVVEKLSDLPYVKKARYPLAKPIAFLAERLEIFFHNGFSIKNLFKVDTASFGLPLWKHPLIKEADMVILNWVNQGMLSLKGIRKICRTGKKVVWVMHDMWNLTGICHHAMGCRRFEKECGLCPLLNEKPRRGKPKDISHAVWQKKKRLYASEESIRFVAVSSWLAEESSKSSLMKEKPIEVIPNPIRIIELPKNETERTAGSKRKILFAAAAIDNWIKGFDDFKEAIAVFKEKYPEEAENVEVVLMGGLKNQDTIGDLALPWTYIGTVAGDENIAAVFSKADVVVNTSRFENLPGTLIEGQAYGAVPVAYDRGGQRDIIDHLQTGYLAPWHQNSQKRAESIADGIAWALSTRPSILPAMRHHVSSRFSYSSVSSRYLST